MDLWVKGLNAAFHHFRKTRVVAHLSHRDVLFFKKPCCSTSALAKGTRPDLSLTEMSAFFCIVKRNFVIRNRNLCGQAQVIDLAKVIKLLHLRAWEEDGFFAECLAL